MCHVSILDDSHRYKSLNMSNHSTFQVTQLRFLHLQLKCKNSILFVDYVQLLRLVFGFNEYGFHIHGDNQPALYKCGAPRHILRLGTFSQPKPLTNRPLTPLPYHTIYNVQIYTNEAEKSTRKKAHHALTALGTLLRG
jgi:hypothetical protein